MHAQQTLETRDAPPDPPTPRGSCPNLLWRGSDPRKLRVSVIRPRSQASPIARFRLSRRVPTHPGSGRHALADGDDPAPRRRRPSRVRPSTSAMNHRPVLAQPRDHPRASRNEFSDTPRPSTIAPRLARPYPPPIHERAARHIALVSAYSLSTTTACSPTPPPSTASLGPSSCTSPAGRCTDCRATGMGRSAANTTCAHFSSRSYSVVSNKLA
jgi:hypothetical protein